MIICLLLPKTKQTALVCVRANMVFNMVSIQDLMTSASPIETSTFNSELPLPDKRLLYRLVFEDDYNSLLHDDIVIGTKCEKREVFCKIDRSSESNVFFKNDDCDGPGLSLVWTEEKPDVLECVVPPAFRYTKKHLIMRRVKNNEIDFQDHFIPYVWSRSKIFFTFEVEVGTVVSRCCEDCHEMRDCSYGSKSFEFAKIEKEIIKFNMDAENQVWLGGKKETLIVDHRSLCESLNVDPVSSIPSFHPSTKTSKTPSTSKTVSSAASAPPSTSKTVSLQSVDQPLQSVDPQSNTIVQSTTKTVFTNCAESGAELNVVADSHIMDVSGNKRKRSSDENLTRISKASFFACEESQARALVKLNVFRDVKEAVFKMNSYCIESDMSTLDVYWDHRVIERVLFQNGLSMKDVTFDYVQLGRKRLSSGNFLIEGTLNTEIKYGSRKIGLDVQYDSCHDLKRHTVLCSDGKVYDELLMKNMNLPQAKENGCLTLRLLEKIFCEITHVLEVDGKKSREEKEIRVEQTEVKLGRISTSGLACLNEALVGVAEDHLFELE